MSRWQRAWSCLHRSRPKPLRRVSIPQTRKYLLSYKPIWPSRSDNRIRPQERRKISIRIFIDDNVATGFQSRIVLSPNCGINLPLTVIDALFIVSSNRLTDSSTGSAFPSHCGNTLRIAATIVSKNCTSVGLADDG